MTLYEKRGRRYFPVRDTNALEGLSNGVWVVKIENGSRAASRQVDTTKTLEQMAAEHDLVDVIVPILRESSAYTWGRGETTRPLSLLEQKAVKAYRDVMGAEATIWMTRPSAWDVAQKVATRLLDLLKEREALRASGGLRCRGMGRRLRLHQFNHDAEKEQE